jgi:ribonuclease HIII
LKRSTDSPIAWNSATSAIDYAKFRSRSHDAVICVYDAAGNVIETHEHNGDFKEWRSANRRVVVSLVDNATFRKCSKIGRQKMELKLPGK